MAGLALSTVQAIEAGRGSERSIKAYVTVLADFEVEDAQAEEKP